MYTHDIYVPGVVEAEILHGAVSEKDQRELHRSLAVYREVDLRNGDWKTLGDQLYMYRINGLTLPLADAIIAATSMKYGFPVWTEDGHFRFMQKIFPDLKFFTTRELLNDL